MPGNDVMLVGRGFESTVRMCEMKCSSRHFGSVAAIKFPVSKKKGNK